MPGPRGVITVNGKAELSLGTKEYTAALTTTATSATFQPNLESMARFPDTAKRLRTILRQVSLARPELN